jgi:hypothetical protein
MSSLQARSFNSFTVDSPAWARTNSPDLAIRVEHYEARIEACVNRNVYAPQNAWNLDEDDPLYEFTNRVTIAGVSTYPQERAGDTYELTLLGDDAPSLGLRATLEDAQARDEYGAPLYCEYRGRQIPIYNPPKGLGLLNKVRGEARWTAFLFVAPRFVNDALALLRHQRNLFLAVHERQDDGARWVHGLRLLEIGSAGFGQADVPARPVEQPCGDAPVTGSGAARTFR